MLKLGSRTPGSPRSKCNPRLNCGLSVNNFCPVTPLFCRRLPWFVLLLLPAWAGSLGASAPSLDEAKQRFDERRYAEAQALFEALHQSYPDHPEALMYLGKLAAKRGERVSALDYFKRALELRPDEAAYHFEYGAACGLYAGTLGKTFKALSYARRAGQSISRAIELAPEDLTYRQGFIEFCLEAPAFAGGGSNRAHAQAEAIAQRNPSAGAFAHASIYRAEGKHPAALATLAELIALDPDNYFARFNFGRCAAESGERLDEGLTHLRACLSLLAPDQAPPPAHVWWNIASIEKQLGNRPAALAALREATSLAPHDLRIADDLASYLASEA